MPRYYFNVRDGVKINDSDGIELADVAEARVKALRISEELLSGNQSADWINEDWKVVVTDHRQLVLFVLQISALTSPKVAGRMARR